MTLSDALRRVVTSDAVQSRLAGGLGDTPDLTTLVTAEEIQAVTGGAPAGEPRRNGAGSHVDVGRMLIWKAQLSNGDQFLITLIAGSSSASAALAMDRMAQECKPLPGVGERGLVRVKTSRTRGTTEIGVNALQGRSTLSLTHTSTHGQKDPGPLAELLGVALTRL